jgi:hypothetical protein
MFIIKLQVLIVCLLNARLGLATAELFAHSTKGEPKKPPPHEPLLVINAGNARTGTMSFATAMKRLGLKCYHMREGVFETPGHIELWTSFLADRNIRLDTVLDEISKEGFNATADAPVNFYYKEQMKRYPEAAVILTVRGEPEDKAGSAFQRSMLATVLRFPPIFAKIPFRWFPSLRRLDPFFAAMYELQFTPLSSSADPDSAGFDPNKLAQFYDEWNAQVIAYVPANKLLIFKATDGWKPLCDHLSPVSPIVAENCRQVLASGEPYPHINDTQSIQRFQFLLRCITTMTYMSPIVLSLAVWTMSSRRNRSKPIKVD